MYNGILSIADIIEIVLLLLACRACYAWGRHDGIRDLAEVLVDNGKLKESDFTDI